MPWTGQLASPVEATSMPLLGRRRRPQGPAPCRRAVLATCELLLEQVVERGEVGDRLLEIGAPARLSSASLVGELSRRSPANSAASVEIVLADGVGEVRGADRPRSTPPTSWTRTPAVPPWPHVDLHGALLHLRPEARSHGPRSAGIFLLRRLAICASSWPASVWAAEIFPRDLGGLVARLVEALLGQRQRVAACRVGRRLVAAPPSAPVGTCRGSRARPDPTARARRRARRGRPYATDRRQTVLGVSAGGGACVERTRALRMTRLRLCRSRSCSGASSTSASG